MRTYNRITIRGYVGADPEVKYVDPTTPVARFTVATEADGYVSPDGRFVTKTVTEWHAVYCYYRLAEVADATVFKGTPVEVEGRLSYTTVYKAGSEPRKVSYIVADKVTLLEKKEAPEAVPEAELPNNPYGDYLDLIRKAPDEEMPF